jgi:hypothetical protein
MASTDFDSGRASGNGSSADEKSTAELAGDLARQMTALIHDEIQLAKAEMTEKGKRAGLGAGMFGGAGLLGVFALGCLTACAVAALALVVSVWLAALLVGLAYLLVAGVIALTARQELDRATPPIPTEALESAKEDVQWLKTRARSARR